MRRVASENRHLHAIVRRGRAAVRELEAALPGAPPSAAVASAAGALSTLVGATSVETCMVEQRLCRCRAFVN